MIDANKKESKSGVASTSRRSRGWGLSSRSRKALRLSYAGVESRPCREMLRLIQEQELMRLQEISKQYPFSISTYLLQKTLAVFDPEDQVAKIKWEKFQ